MRTQNQLLHLIIDLGNTRSKFAVFIQGKQIVLETFDDLTKEGVIQFLNKTRGSGSAILSAVIEIPEWLPVLIEERFKILYFNHKTRVPLRNLYMTPETLGRDRLACAAGAQRLFPGVNVLSIDAGTCIKYDFVNAAGDYLGGAISPGINMRLKAMHTFTARLPLVVPEADVLLIGRSTEESLRTGAVKGAIAEVNGMIEFYNIQYKDVKVLISGGDRKYFDNQAKNSIFAHPNLVVFGLHEILLFNEI
jgi:type III pantothenate kinase